MFRIADSIPKEEEDEEEEEEEKEDEDEEEEDEEEDDDDDEGKSSPMSRVPTALTSNMNHFLVDAKNSGAFLSFSGDAEDEPVDLFASAQKAVEEMGRIRRGGTRAERYWVSAYLVPG